MNFAGLHRLRSAHAHGRLSVPPCGAADGLPTTASGYPKSTTTAVALAAATLSAAASQLAEPATTLTAALAAA